MRTCVNAWSIIMVNQNNKKRIFLFSWSLYMRGRESYWSNNFTSNYKLHVWWMPSRKLPWCSRRGTACEGGFSQEVRLGRDNEGQWRAVAGAPCMRWQGEYEVWETGSEPGKHGARRGHRSGQGPCDRTSLLYEQWVPVKGVKREDGQMTSILWKEHSGSSKGRYKWTWEVTELALTQVAVEEICMALRDV